MALKNLLLVFIAIGVAPAVLWSILSIVTACISIVHRPFSLSFRLYSSGVSTTSFEYHELPLLTSLCILAGSALIIFGVASIPRNN